MDTRGKNIVLYGRIEKLVKLIKDVNSSEDVPANKIRCCKEMLELQQIKVSIREFARSFLTIHRKLPIFLIDLVSYVHNTKFQPTELFTTREKMIINCLKDRFEKDVIIDMFRSFNLTVVRREELVKKILDHLEIFCTIFFKADSFNKALKSNRELSNFLDEVRGNKDKEMEFVKDILEELEKRDKDGASTDCGVCLADFTYEKFLFFDPCLHKVCKSCLPRLSFCPFCRGTIKKRFNAKEVTDKFSSSDTTTVDADADADADAVIMKSIVGRDDFFDIALIEGVVDENSFMNTVLYPALGINKPSEYQQRLMCLSAFLLPEMTLEFINNSENKISNQLSVISIYSNLCRWKNMICGSKFIRDHIKTPYVFLDIYLNSYLSSKKNASIDDMKVELTVERFSKSTLANLSRSQLNKEFECSKLYKIKEFTDYFRPTRPERKTLYSLLTEMPTRELVDELTGNPLSNIIFSRLHIPEMWKKKAHQDLSCRMLVLNAINFGKRNSGVWAKKDGKFSHKILDAVCDSILTDGFEKYMENTDHLVGFENERMPQRLRTTISLFRLMVSSSQDFTRKEWEENFKKKLTDILDKNVLMKFATEIFCTQYKFKDCIETIPIEKGYLKSFIGNNPRDMMKALNSVKVLTTAKERHECKFLIDKQGECIIKKGKGLNPVINLQEEYKEVLDNHIKECFKSRNLDNFKIILDREVSYVDSKITSRPVPGKEDVSSTTFESALIPRSGGYLKGHLCWKDAPGTKNDLDLHVIVLNKDYKIVDHISYDKRKTSYAKLSEDKLSAPVPTSELLTIDMEKALLERYRDDIDEEERIAYFLFIVKLYRSSSGPCEFAACWLSTGKTDSVNDNTNNITCALLNQNSVKESSMALVEIMDDEKYFGRATSIITRYSGNKDGNLFTGALGKDRQYTDVHNLIVRESMKSKNVLGKPTFEDLSKYFFSNVVYVNGLDDPDLIEHLSKDDGLEVILVSAKDPSKIPEIMKLPDKKKDFTLVTKNPHVKWEKVKPSIEEIFRDTSRDDLKKDN